MPEIETSLVWQIVGIILWVVVMAVLVVLIIIDRPQGVRRIAGAAAITLGGLSALAGLMLMLT